MNLNLLFAWSTGAFVAWYAPMACTVLQIDTKAPCIVSVGGPLAYPTSAPVQNVPFVSTQAGVIACSFHLEAGDLMYVNGAATVTVAWAYLPDPPVSG